MPDAGCRDVASLIIHESKNLGTIDKSRHYDRSWVAACELKVPNLKTAKTVSHKFVAESHQNPTALPTFSAVADETG